MNENSRKNHTLLKFKINTFLFGKKNQDSLKENQHINRKTYTSLNALIKYSKKHFNNFKIMYKFDFRNFQ